jgi:hypothetical protein
MKKKKLLIKLEECARLIELQGDAILDMVKDRNQDFDELDCMIDIAGKMMAKNEPIVHEGPGGHFYFGCNQNTTADVKPKPETFTRFDMLNFAKYANPEYCAGQWIGLDELLDYFIKNKGK